ncbi:MAG: enoyl-CoA hydratase/isomerase family protein [Burkholderiaceae bacterium]
MSDANLVLYEQTACVAVLTLNRPQALNALNLALLQELSALLDRVRDDAVTRAVIITANGTRAFCAGADIAYLNSASPLAVREFAMRAIEVNRMIETLGKPVVAAINGAALGGGLELAESCMFRIAARGTTLGHPEVRIGAIAGFGGTTRLPRLVGRARAAEMLLRGRVVEADEALQIGLVHAVVESSSLRTEADSFLSDVLAQSPTAVRLTWEAMHLGLNLSVDESAQLGADYFGLAAASEDFRVGTRAFLEKRRPEWLGN